MAPLQDILVLDFSTLLPGPMATLCMAEAGAQVIKIERPGTGDEMRSYQPQIEGESVNFAMLNRGKSSLVVDLKNEAERDRLLPLLRRADIIIEQFRPGVMDRLGLGYDDICKINPDIIFCSISGWGGSGPKASLAGHDLNYMAETGVLGLSVGADGAPILPPILAADIAGGTYPALVNILLALRTRDKSGNGCWLDISMGQSLFTFMYWALGNAHALNRWPIPGGETVTGGSPRYQIYRTADDRYIAAAPLEDKFWANFTRIIGLSPALCNDSVDPAATGQGIAALIAERTAAQWSEAFAGQDVCCSVVLSLEEALKDPQWAARGVFDDGVEIAGKTIPALPTVVSPIFRKSTRSARAPKLDSGIVNQGPSEQKG